MEGPWPLDGGSSEPIMKGAEKRGERGERGEAQENAQRASKELERIRQIRNLPFPHFFETVV